MKTPLVFSAIFLAQTLAFANPAMKTLDNQLRAQIPAGSTGIILSGQAASGNDCEVSIGLEKGQITLGLIEKGMMGMAFYDLGYIGKPVLGVATAGAQITIQSKDRNGNPQETVLNFSSSGQLKSAEVREEADTLFGFGARKMKSASKCNLD